VVKLALATPPEASVTAFVKSTVPYGFVTESWTIDPASGAGVMVAVIVPVCVLR